ncbi:hypothetical protein BOW53_05665 [Solemya pervernicosa gill symbiont]|uniref:diguanylate cyclase n=2 Tax=Solemya pervernicosa gill symbiont TaxID=642797 RepID=A0A1T2L7H4_9GAMM|nr:hypothetical protein BOW53_05665 [Solemya pervernicosa gill symbiont]
MNLQQKALAIVIPLITLLTAGYSYFVYVTTSEHIEQIVATEREQLHQQHTHYFKMMIDQRYQHELRQLLITPGLVDVFARQDRAALLDLADPVWRLLRAENPNVARLHFHRADGTSLLRVHLPRRYGDDIAALRPMLQTIHANHQPISAVEMGRHGLFYRVMQPIMVDGNYLGAVELGLSMKFVTNALRHMLGIESLILIGHKALEAYDAPIDDTVRLGDYILWSSSSDIRKGLDALQKGFDINQDANVITHGTQTHLLHTSHMPTIEGSPKAAMLFVQDLTPYIEKRNHTLFGAIISAVLVVVIFIITLRLTLSPLLSNLVATNRKLSEKIDEVTRLSITDPLTQIFNRVQFNHSLSNAITLAERYNTPFSLLMFDLDHFKRINDDYGHPAGDRVLIQTTEIVTRLLRSNDTFARWGGEEFMVILPHQGVDEGRIVAEKIRTLIADHSFDGIEHVTLSVGITQYREGDDIEQILHRVDINLYHAKQQGRNQTIADQD